MLNSMHSMNLRFDLGRALEALKTVSRRYPFEQCGNQITLTHRSESNQTPQEGSGSLFEHSTGSWKAYEKDFRFFNEEFKNTYFYEIYREMQKRTNGAIGRVRLMRLPPKVCYSLHRDSTIRFHLALVSNPQAFLLFAPAELISIPVDGSVYAVDTRRAHSAFNGGDEDRIHLVMSAAEESNEQVFSFFPARAAETESLNLDFPEEIAGEGVSLKRISPEMGPSIDREVRSSPSRFKAFAPWFKKENTEKEIADWIDRSRKESDGRRLFEYAGFVGDQWIGVCGLYLISENHRSCEIGYWVGKDFEGKGLAFEMFRTLEAEVYRRGFHRIQLRCAAGNPRSVKIALRNGYQVEGYLRDCFVAGGEYGDLLILAKLNGGLR